MTNEKLKKSISEYAKKIGFDLIGFTKAKVDTASVKNFNEWLRQEYEGDMAWMENEKRKKVTSLLDGAKSVIVLAMNYYLKQAPLKKGYGRIARYAYGRDYHKVIKKKLQKIQDFITSQTVGTEIKVYVDTGPLLERSLASQAGIGVIGKNSCLIAKEYGSWVFLAEIITTIDFKPDQPSGVPFSKCGSCTRCIDACPTNAIKAPGVIDARRCLSYITIEHKGVMPQKYADILSKNKQLYGCDICQEVCPHNVQAKESTHIELQDPCIAGDQLKLQDLLTIKTDGQFLDRFAGSPLMRAKRRGLHRNAKACLHTDVTS